MKRTRLIALLALLVFSSGPPWTSTNGRTQERIPPNRLDFVPVGTPFGERFGVDDGAVLAVHFSGEIHGGLEPCG
ncbi:MAG TPA: hypothetical protein VJH03_09415 [Blastocatellia bacterium]|nr:hypothetical protein [Blastocatellia bacterium]